jgi:hypothetical protein
MDDGWMVHVGGKVHFAGAAHNAPAKSVDEELNSDAQEAIVLSALTWQLNPADFGKFHGAARRNRERGSCGPVSCHELGNRLCHQSGNSFRGRSAWKLSYA